MLSWVFRGVLIVGFPLIVYFGGVSHSKAGLLVGFAVAVGLVLIEMLIESISLITIIAGSLGAAAGLLASKTLDYLTFQMVGEEFYRVWDQYELLRNLALGVLGMVIFIRKFPELDTLDKDILAAGKRRGSSMKVMDTSAIIDGRVVDICETKFLAGTLVVPRFVLQELHRLADNAEGMKRARGRRGLDMLARMQENQDLSVKIMDKDVPAVDDVDGKVVRLAKDLGACVVTTDFNLNKIAAVEGVICLNVNDLTLALKPVVLPGESMGVFVMKEGKERDQGVGYLDDGTMVVVEDGKRHIGKRVDLVVSSILQTSAGRMVFGRYRGDK
ncbi:MAG TPA: PIN domain nuclease [Elusimicrobia bacterium]|nr:PIN domain nuclease [Elusimicrobiota bacterium]